jgi:transketolase
LFTVASARQVQDDSTAFQIFNSNLNNLIFSYLMSQSHLPELCKQVRYNILRSTTAAGTGHPTSSLSAVEFMSALMFGGFFKTELDNPVNPNNDRLIFSKGHACPLLYSLYYAAGHVSEAELMNLRKFGNVLEGHPTMNWKYTEAATGSLGQGLGVAAGMALALQRDFVAEQSYPNVWCILGDSEMAEGSIWEAMNCGAYNNLNNLIAIVDLNRLGQRGETQIGHDTATLEAKANAFGWETFVVDGHDLDAIEAVYSKIANSESPKPKMVIAKTFKGAGISFLQDKDGWHGKALPQEDCERAIDELGIIDTNMKWAIPHPETSLVRTPSKSTHSNFEYNKDDKVATRLAYGNALNNLGANYADVVALDAEMNNSTFANIFAKNFPDRYFEMFIAEQNMVSVATGLSRMGRIPFVSTFAAFHSRATDQIRMAQYSHANIKVMGSHCGVSIGPDGSSQMAVEDLSLFRAILGSVVLYPSDAVCTDRLVQKMADHKGISYLRCTRADVPVIYDNSETFQIGGSKTIFSSPNDKVTVIAAGITLFEAIKAAKELAKENIMIRVIDLYSIKPLDKTAIAKACQETQALITVEDHLQEGGIFEAVSSCGVVTKPVHCLAVKKMSCSGTPAELLRFMEIDADAIIRKVKEVLVKPILDIKVDEAM